MRSALFASLASLALASGAAAHDPARATYLGNEGVMVARGDTKIVFDAFYADSYGEYLIVPATIHEALLAGKAPFDGVDAVFVSHVHGDHFSPAPMIAFLRAQPSVVLYAPAQARRALIAAGVAESDPILARVRAFDLAPVDAAQSVSVGALTIDVVSLPHAGDLKDIQNYSWRVTLDGRTTVVHFGDAGAVPENFERHRAHFAAKPHDAAFPPFWWFLEDAGREVLGTHIRATKTIGVHVPASALGKGDAARAEFGGDVFTDPGETRGIEGE